LWRRSIHAADRSTGIGINLDGRVGEGRDIGISGRTRIAPRIAQVLGLLTAGNGKASHA
jgi:hypothetical protein